MFFRNKKQEQTKTTKKGDTTLVRNRRGNLWCVKLHSFYTIVCEPYEYIYGQCLWPHMEKQEYIKGLQLYRNMPVDKD